MQPEKGTGKWCFVPFCPSSSTRTPKKIFVRVPYALKTRKIWSSAAKREDAETLTSRHPWHCCEDHFEPEKDFANYMRQKLMGGKVLLKKGVIPHKFVCQRGSFSDAAQRSSSKRNQKEIADGALMECDEQITGRTTSSKSLDKSKIEDVQRSNHMPEPVDLEEDDNDTPSSMPKQQQGTAAVEIDVSRDDGDTPVPGISAEPSDQCGFRIGYFDIMTLKEPGDLQVLTGIKDMTDFNMMMTLFEPAFTRQMNGKTPTHIQNITFANMLAMTLAKFRHNMSCELLGTMFNVKTISAAFIFRSMVRTMHDVLREVNMWPEKYDHRLPVVIIDCVELKIYRPSEVGLPPSTSSTDKGMVKILIGVTPQGAISFVSKAFCGSTSDQLVFEKSGLLGLLKAGDIVLSDRDFSIPVHVTLKGVQVVSAAFLKGRVELLPVEVAKSPLFAQQRVRVERFIGLTNTYKFLRDPIHHKHVPIAGEAFFVACALFNMRPAPLE